MNNENLEMLQQIFEDADEDGGGGLDIEEFGQAMKMAFGMADELDDEQLQLMFMKVSHFFPDTTVSEKTKHRTS